MPWMVIVLIGLFSAATIVVVWAELTMYDLVRRREKFTWWQSWGLRNDDSARIREEYERITTEETGRRGPLLAVGDYALAVAFAAFACVAAWAFLRR